MSSTTRATKKKVEIDETQRRRRPAGPVKSERSTVATSNVEHAGQEPLDAFLREITKHAPWDVWARRLAERKHPLPLHKLLPRAETCPLAWSAGPGTALATIQLLDWLCAVRPHRHRSETPGDWPMIAEEWLDALATREATSDLALEAIAWGHALPRLAIRLPAVIWSRLVARIIELASGVPSPASFEDVEANALLLTQLMAGELPLTLAYVFPKVELCQRFRRPAREVVSAGLLASLDGEGIPHARLVKFWRPLLACWTRCVSLDRQVSGKRVSKDATLQFEWLVRQSLRFARADGTMMLSNDRSTDGRHRGLIRSALEFGGDRVDRELFDIQRGRVKPEASDFALPLAGERSEWAELAVLRADWTSRSTCLAATFDQGMIKSELMAGSRRLWLGSTLPEVRLDGVPLDTQGEWEELCWLSDKDVDFIELEIDLTRGWRLQRQMLLARQDQFLLTADVLLGPQPGLLDYRLELPLDPQITLRQQDETSEVQWVADKPLAWVLPLALSEWRFDSRDGRFDGRVLYQTARSTGLYAPLFIDLSSKRQTKPLTWRQLTVAEDLRLLPRDVAVAYRVQVGSRQWIVYRSLGKIGNRTFLGQNVMSEFLVSRFQTNGELDDLIEIE
jgi:hypothetical protein